jgi:hypothetical protein
MSKASNAAALFLEKNQKGKQLAVEEFKEAFEVQNPVKVSNFRGMFGAVKLVEGEEQDLLDLLEAFQKEEKRSEQQLQRDFEKLLEITASVRGIRAQSILLQGEQIKAAQTVLKNYREGAFSKWLITAYGNRQTPYSILQYYEFYQKLSPLHRQKIELMPKKAAYTLAAREGDFDKKVKLLDGYDQEKPASETMLLVQETFPKSSTDKRRGKSFMEAAIDKLELLCGEIEARQAKLSLDEKRAIRNCAKRLLECC